MTERDLTRVMTEHVADVHLPDEVVRRIRMAAKEEKPVKKKMSLAIALVMVLMLLAVSAAVAAGTGILDYLRVWSPHLSLLPGSDTLVVQNLGQCETTHAIFTFREAVSDGRGASVMVEVIPKEADMLLIPEFMRESDKKSGASMTYGEYAQAHGNLRLIPVTCYPVGNQLCNRYWIEEEGKLIAIVNFALPDDNAPIPMYCTTSNGIGNIPRTATFDLTLTNVAPLWTLTREISTTIEELDIRIDRIHLTSTPLALYTEVEWTTLTEEANSVWFDIADAQGKALPFNPLIVSRSAPLGDQQFSYLVCSQPQEAPPASLMLMVYTSGFRHPLSSRETPTLTLPVTLE